MFSRDSVRVLLETGMSSSMNVCKQMMFLGRFCLGFLTAMAISSMPSCNAVTSLADLSMVTSRE